MPRSESLIRIEILARKFSGRYNFLIIIPSSLS